jgi:PAS domain S-box-containing protein
VAVNRSSDPDFAQLRRRAEHEAEAQGSNEVDAQWPAEARRVLHELRVHQIELGIQNEELRFAREELEASRARYFDLYDLAPVGYFTLSKAGLILEANLTAAVLLGVARSALRGKRFSSFILSNDEVIYRLLGKTLSEIGTPQTCELRMTKKDAAPFWARLEEVEALDERGTPCTRVVISDITERKLAERKLFEEHERLESLLRALPVGVGFSDDPTCERITGNPTLLAQFNAHPADNLSASAPDARALGRRVRYVREGRQINQAELPLQCAVREGRMIPPVELEVELPGGRRWFAEASAAPIRGPEDAIVGGVAVVADITSRKQAEEKKHEQKLKDEFLDLLGHELRNPLAAISNSMEMLSAGVTAGERASLEELMGRQVRVLRRLLDDLLDMSRIKHGQICLQREPIDLSDLLRVAAAAAQPAATERAQEMVARTPHDPVWFLADRVRLKQIAANLLDNACKYTDRGGRIELSGASEGSEVVIRCRDNGRGIPLEMQQRIFEPLTRLELAGPSADAGLGIGPALVKRLAELYGGTVSVESAGPGAGSEFIVRLPLVEALPMPPEVTKTKPARRQRRSLSIVLVEDNPDVAHTLALTLERAGHRVTHFADGPSALVGVVGLEPDAVVLDIGLPGMDGYKVAAKMKTKANLRSVLFIGLSGFKRRARAGKSGGDFDYYFLKPVDRARLLAVLDRCARAEAADAPTARKGREPLRVLLVDDNRDLAIATEGLLRREGLEVRTAFSGQEALDAVRDFRPHLILCDMSLPDMSGLEVIRKLRSISAAGKPQAVMLTARSEREIRAYNREAKELGIEEFVSKPITPEVVRTLIAKLMTLAQGFAP